jgi:hypothetical protein
MMLGHGEPIRVKVGERVLFHVLNASAGESAASRNVFRVIWLDGNPVRMQAEVPALWLGTAERISAIVEMKHPGVWVMGDLNDDDPGHGMGIMVEYANTKGKPQWSKPRPYKWNYTIFGKAGTAPASPVEAVSNCACTLRIRRNHARTSCRNWSCPRSQAGGCCDCRTSRIALVGFVLLIVWQAPPLVVVAISALVGIVLPAIVA